MPPEQVLAERFARGKIDEEEYRRRLAAPREERPASQSAGRHREGNRLLVRRTGRAT
ncbi:SHOCT domain-containing protein [Streptomyces sp. NPDC055722]